MFFALLGCVANPLALLQIALLSQKLSTTLGAQEAVSGMAASAPAQAGSDGGGAVTAAMELGAMLAGDDGTDATTTDGGEDEPEPEAAGEGGTQPG